MRIAVKKQIFGLLVGLLGGLAVAADRPPNVLFILVDDMGWADFSGNNPETFYETPNLQRLADSGVNFLNGYAASPVCSPTRSSILTGQYPARTRNTDYFGGPNEYFGKLPAADTKPNVKKMGHHRGRPVWPAPYLGELAKSHVTLPEALKEHGYATFFAGKWHLGREPGSWPEHHGFDVNVGGHSSGGPYGGKKYFSPYGNPRMKDGPAGEHLPDRLANETVSFMAAHKDKPFLAYLSFYSVHTPLIGRPDLVKKYEARNAEHPVDPKKLHGYEHPRKIRQVQNHAVYAAMVEAMDLAVGKVLDGLEQHGLADNTIVIFTSDNGGEATAGGAPTSNLPLRGGKGWLYEGGIREPVIVRWPGRGKAGATSQTCVTSTDFYPTILDMCGLPARPEQTKDGHSFAKAVAAPSADTGRPALFWHYPHWGNQGGIPGSAVRLGDWKYVEYYWGKEPELFNLADDLGEQRNLAAANSEKVAELKTLIDQNRTATQALAPTPNPNFTKSFEDATW